MNRIFLKIDQYLEMKGHYSYQLLAQLAWRNKKYVFLFFVLGLVAAAFEGGTMIALAMALQIVTDLSGTLSLGAEYGRVGAIFETVTAGIEPSLLFIILIGAAVANQFLYSVASFGADLANAKLVSRSEGYARQNLFRQYMSVTYAQIRQYKAGDLTSYNEQTVWVGATLISLGVIANQIFLMTAYTIVLLWLSWSLTLGAMLVSLLIVFSLRRIIRRIRLIAQKYTQATVNLNAYVVEFIYGLRVVRTFAREPYAIQRVETYIDRSVRGRYAVLKWQAAISPLIDMLTVTGLAAILVGGYYLAGDARLAVLAKLATFLFVLYRLMPRISIINKNWSKVIGWQPFVERVALMLRTQDKEYTHKGDAQFSGLQMDVVFKNVSLQYAIDDPWAVRNVSFRVVKGQMVAFVGESGAGKSTTIDLLLRLYEPTEGEILVDGVNLSDIHWRSWRECLGVVSQDTFVFHAPIRENIAFGKLDATDEEIVAAAKAANVHDFVMEMPDGYDTMIGDQGHRLSGGQRQRISIARAILRNPDILILDEATSSLDSQAEQQIQEALESLSSQRTVVAIAHRLSTVRHADRIIVLDKGVIVEEGTHEELLERDGRYAYLWELQSGHSGREDD